MTLAEMLAQIHKLLQERPDALNLPVYCTVGSSGASYSLSYPSVESANQYSDGDLLELDPGDEYIGFYAGN